jgi:hypothetical protein
MQIGALNTKDLKAKDLLTAAIPIYGAYNIGSKIFGETEQEKKIKEFAVKQRQRAGELKGQLDATERPQKTAMVDRLLEMYSGDLGMTSEQKQLAQENIARGEASALRDVSSLGGGLRNVGQIQSQSADASQKMAATDAQMEQQQRMSIGQMLAQAESEAEQYNKLLPYEQMLAEYQNTLGASMQNEMLQSQLVTQRGAQNLQMGMDLWGAGIGLASGNVGALAGAAGGGQTPQLNKNGRMATTGNAQHFINGN